MEVLEVRLRMSTAFHPQTDGSTERMNRLVIQMMRNLVNLRQDNWSKCLPAIEFAINSYQNSATKKAPFELVYGRIPNSAFLNTLPIINVPQAESFLKDLADNWKIAHDIATQTREHYTKWYNAKHTPPPKFEVGQQELLSRKNINTKDTVQNKLSPLFIGPFKIIEAYSNIDDYKLGLLNYLKVYPVFHVSLLRPYYLNNDKQFPSHKHAHPPSVPALEEQEEERYEVAAIVDHRYNKRTRNFSYRVRWKGYPPSEDSWEPEEHLSGAQDIIKEYNKHLSSFAFAIPPRRRRQMRRFRNWVIFFLLFFIIFFLSHSGGKDVTELHIIFDLLPILDVLQIHSLLFCLPIFCFL